MYCETWGRAARFGAAAVREDRVVVPAAVATLRPGAVVEADVALPNLHQLQGSVRAGDYRHAAARRGPILQKRKGAK